MLVRVKPASMLKHVEAREENHGETRNLVGMHS